jgi:hypothetical protein
LSGELNLKNGWLFGKIRQSVQESGYKSEGIGQHML